MKNRILVATRPSKLALKQTEIVVDMLKKKFPELEVEIVKVSTKGDLGHQNLSLNLKSAFTYDIETLLIDGKVDVAIHSLKDLPSNLDDRLTIIATPSREDPRDVLVSKDGKKLEDLPLGSRLGTSSLRRKVQLRYLRKDIEIMDIHGNVDTRISKFEKLNLDGVILAAAGLIRLGMHEKISQFFKIEDIVPAPGQGIIAVEILKRRKDLSELFGEINDNDIFRAALCERSFMDKIGGGCDVPTGIYAEVKKEEIRAIAFLASSDGSRMVKRTYFGRAEEPMKFGAMIADEIRKELKNA
ncbi:MAG TPA: hydroxymethylbilane synthase [Geobacterales bacterium]|nr:hydroxymethylbilane synthase [Geobacterales bacterium]